MRRTLTILFALVSLAAAGACGNEADTTADDSADSAEGRLTKEEFIEQGDAICSELSLATGRVEAPADETDFARYLTEVRGEAETARESWEQLEPPADGEDVHQAVLDQLTNAIESVDGAITAAESGDTVTAGDLLREADEAGDAVDAEAQAYGFTECGKDNAEEEGGDTGGQGGQGGSEEAPEDQPLPEEPDPAPVDEQPAEDQPADAQPGD